MTNHKLVGVTMLMILLSFTGKAQNKKTNTKKEITFSVAGNCGMCKSRIEDALDIKGIKFAEWDQKTKICTVIYNAEKIDEGKVHQTIAAIGHDTEKVRATDQSYEELHHCCHYSRLAVDNKE